MRYSRGLLYSPETRKLELLTTPLSRLDISLDEGPLGKAIAVARDDLHRVGLRRLTLNFYLSTGYGTVEGTTNIALGFYDTNRYLRELHREYRRWLYSPQDILATVRHELGHAFCYAYKLYRRKDFRETFNVRGHFFRSYPLTNRYVIRANPYSRDFVNPMGDHYAQKHPDDDFAETFAVWLSPRRTWKRKYRRFPGAMKKLRFVDRVVAELRRSPPEIENDPDLLDEQVEDQTITVAQFLKARTTRYRRLATGYVDPDLRRMFRRASARTRNSSTFVPAAQFIRANRPLIINRVGAWIRVDPMAIRDLVEKCHDRARDLDLVLKGQDEEGHLLAFTSYIAARCQYYAIYGRYFPR